MNKKFLLYTTFFTLFFGSVVYFYAFYNKNSEPTINSKMNNYVIQNTYPSPTFKILVMADTHENSEIFPVIKDYLSKYPVNYVVHLGDLSNFGDLKALSTAKHDLSFLSTPYVALPGDHDIAQTSDESNFYKEFSMSIPFDIEGVRVSFIPNEFNFTPFKPAPFLKFLDEVSKSDIIFTSQPIFVDKNLIFSDRYMGSLENSFQTSGPTYELLKVYNQQRNQLLNEIRKTKSTKLVISGDHHISSIFTDPVNKLVTYHLTGALAKEIYLGSKSITQKSLQSQRFTIISLYKINNENQFKIEEVPVENISKSAINKE